MKNVEKLLKTRNRSPWINLKGIGSLITIILMTQATWSQVWVQNQLTDCVYFGDINGDNIDDIITVNDRKITVSKPDVRSSPLFTHTFPAKVKRLMIGDFANSGRERGKKQLAAILDNGTTQVFAISNDGRSLRLWFTQTTFIEEPEQFSVANFDGDVAEEIMVHNPATGRIRFFKKGNNTNFTLMRNFETGNLAGNGPEGTSLTNTQILAGSFFNDHPGRKDLMVIDHNARQLRVYGSVLLPNGNLTFWWAFTTNSNMYPAGSQLCVANLDGSTKDGLLIRNAGSGTYSLFKVDYGNGSLVQETSVNAGQLPIVTGEARIAAAKVRDLGFRNERGGATRDDILLFQASNNQLTRTDARASGTNLTYWWAYNKILTTCNTGLYGFVDMHTHPMARWGFGEELFWGENDGNPATALGRCACFHRGWDLFNNQCGNTYRETIVNKTDISGHNTMGGHYPSFESWPKHNAVLHQQMWVDWIKRAYEGGLRVMVGLAVNNHCIADAAETKGPNDDFRSMNTQIQKLKEFVGRHQSFMQIAYSAADVRRILQSNKLAVILGVEMDNIGNFYNPADGKGGAYKPNPTESDVRNEINRLYSLGVRYIFPVHLTNNAFGGAAIYLKDFNVPNKYNTGAAFVPEVVDSRTSGITFKLQHPFTDLGLGYGLVSSFTGDILPGHIMPHRMENYPNYPDPGINKGHRNSLGLTDRGRFAVKYMMQKGMMIDIDHCSEKAVTEILSMADRWQYPVNSGHNGPRGTEGNENGRTDNQYRTIQRLGGMIGLGHGDNANGFLSAYRKVLSLTGNRQVGIGTDVNGFHPLPGPPPVNGRITYNNGLSRYTMGAKTWDFNTEGMAHYGLFPDYIRSWEAAGLTQAEKNVFYSSAEYFTQMWEKCETRKSNVR